MTVVEDFDDDSVASREKRTIGGILRAGDQNEFIIDDGNFLTFGKDLISDVVIPIDEIDEK